MAKENNPENTQGPKISRRTFLKASGAVVTSAALYKIAKPAITTATAGTDATTSGNQTQDTIDQQTESRLHNRQNVKIEKLLEPGYIGKVKTRNRMIKTAALGWILHDDQKGVFRPEGLAYYAAIAKGGVGLQVMEDPAFRPFTWGRPFYNDSYIEHEKELVDLMHKYNCPTFVQLTDSRPLIGLPNTAASSAFNYPSKLDMNNALPKAMSLAEVHEEIDLIAKAGWRCKKAGYDGIEINCACSHMFATFLSRFWNKRTDEYGPQSLENRCRIVVEMIQGIKNLCGADYPVGILMNGYEINVFELGNNTDCSNIEESIATAKIFENAGADSIQVRSASIGNHINGFFPDLYYMFEKGKANNGYGMDMDIKKYWPQFVTEYDGAGAFIETAGQIKKALHIPVIVVGSMDPRLIPDVVENAIRDGKIDFVAMTRPLTADPELPKKIIEGRMDDIRPCAHCITCFPMSRCRVNAASTRAEGAQMPEGYDVQPATTKKKVMIIGAGPAGMEAARVAALRGHEVTLYEKSSRLGGLMPLAAMVKGEHEKILDFVTYLANQIDKLGVDVKLGKEVNAALVKKVKPDAVIVANGGAATTPNIPGINKSIVMSSDSLHKTLETGLRFIRPFTLRTLTNFYMPIGKKVIIIGGQIQGVQLAEFLAQRGRDVTIVDEDKAANLGLFLPSFVKDRVLLYDRSHGVKILMGVKYGEITDTGMTITTSFGIEKTIEADSIVLALPSAINTALADSLKSIVSEVYTVGDCSKVGVMVDAVEAGNLTARKI
jgi:2,4-dienoyl-CoA reductase (NADPH2)